MFNMADQKLENTYIEGEKSDEEDNRSYNSDTPLIDNTVEKETLALKAGNERQDVDSTDIQSGESSYGDNDSFSSEIPLIDSKQSSEDPVETVEDQTSHYKLDYSDGKSFSPSEIQDIVVTVLDNAKDREDFPSAVQFQSALSLHYSEQQAGNMTPIPIIGSGWEFGSICSINIHPDNATGTVDTLKRTGQDRLLSRIFSKTVGYLEIHSHSQQATDKTRLSTVEVCGDPVDDIKEDPIEGRNSRNLLILSLSMTLLHTAVYGLRNLQSSLNTESGLGVYSLAAIFAAFMLSSLVSPFIVKRFPAKRCLCLATFGHLPYLMANYYPTFPSLILSSALMGFSNAVLWNALCTYITEIGIQESVLKTKSAGNVLSRFFGIFFLTLQLSVVFGNLISSVILSSAYNRGHISDNQYLTKSNTTAEVVTLNLTGTNCGMNGCNDLVDSSGNQSVDELDKLFLLGTYSTCTIIAILVLNFLLDHLPHFTPQPIKMQELFHGIGDTIAMVIDRKFIFIALLCMYTVFSTGFVIADVLKAFITCPLGVQMVGYSMICFGICGALSSYVFGKLTKCCGRVPVFLAAAMLNLGSLGVMAFWDPASRDQWFLMGLLGVWGFADGIWQSQINSLISTVFAERYECAFSCCRVLQGMAGIIIFLMSNATCMMYKLVFIGASCIMSVTLYIVMEILLKREHKLVSEIEVEA